MFQFEKDFSIEKRVEEANRIVKKYPNRIPVIVEKSNHSDIPDMEKKKFLVPRDITMGQFTYIIRKRIELSSEQAMFMFVNNSLVPTSKTISTVYEEHKKEDNFLYMRYSGENTFGSP